jgi:hypothetical protein
MASASAALLCALTGFALWTLVGYLIALRLPLPLYWRSGLAPVLGWAVQTSLALALSLFFGFSLLSILAPVALAAAALLCTPQHPGTENGASLPVWIFVGAALLALLPATAILPKVIPGGILLSDPMFDHSKIALIDQMLREGLPPANPVIGGAQKPSVAYYYLWHFGAAEVGRLAGSSGWEADVASTWFTAYSCLCLMCSLAAHLARRVLAPVFVLVACATASIRPVLGWIFGEDRVDQVFVPASGLRGWLFQTTWSPHHMASASCSVLAVLLLVRLSRRRSVLTAAVLTLVFAAAFESSLWVGGIVLVLAACTVVPVLTLFNSGAHRRWFLLATAGAVVLAGLLCEPLIAAQFHAAAARGGGIPIGLGPPQVLGPWFPESLRRPLDLLAYWLILLVVEFPVILVAGWMFVGQRLRERRRALGPDVELLALALLAGVSLCCGWLLVSTAGLNNDLGWRAVLPAVLVLTSTAAAGFARWLSQRSVRAVTGVLASLAFAAPEGLQLVASEFHGLPSPSAGLFSQAPQLWEAVRRHTPVDARVASNPLLFADITPWPVNISWALLANRRSCYAGEELAIAFAPISAEQRWQMSERFQRVFQGQAQAQDLAMLSQTYDCRIAVVTAQDGAWQQDPFAGSAYYTLVESRPNRWRIYARTSSEGTQQKSPEHASP